MSIRWKFWLRARTTAELQRLYDDTPDGGVMGMTPREIKKFVPEILPRAGNSATGRLVRAAALVIRAWDGKDQDMLAAIQRLSHARDEVCAVLRSRPPSRFDGELRCEFDAKE